MIVYGSPISPFVRKVLLVAAEKAVAVESAGLRPGQPDPGFLEASPFRKMPAIRDGDFTLCDSTAIATYLDAKYPEPPMLPAAPEARGKAIWFEEFADTLIAPAAGKVLFNRVVAPKLLGKPGDEMRAKEGEAELEPMLDWFEQQAPAQGFLAGAFSIGDIAVAAMFKTLSYGISDHALAGRPMARAWYERVQARDAWRTVADREAVVVAPLLAV